MKKVPTPEHLFRSILDVDAFGCDCLIVVKFELTMYQEWPWMDLFNTGSCWWLLSRFQVLSWESFDSLKKVIIMVKDLNIKIWYIVGSISSLIFYPSKTCQFTSDSSETKVKFGICSQTSVSGITFAFVKLQTNVYPILLCNFIQLAWPGWWELCGTYNNVRVRLSLKSR